MQQKGVMMFDHRYCARCDQVTMCIDGVCEPCKQTAARKRREFWIAKTEAERLDELLIRVERLERRRYESNSH